MLLSAEHISQVCACFYVCVHTNPVWTYACLDIWGCLFAKTTKTMPLVSVGTCKMFCLTSQYVLYDTHSSSSEKVLQSLQGERYTVVNIIKKIHSAFIKQVIHACICETLYVNRVDSQGVLILLHMASICTRKQIRKQITNMLCKDFAKPGEKVFRFTWNKMSFMNLTWGT